MLVRAERRAAEKDHGVSGTSPVHPPKFPVLPDHSDSHFLNVASSSGIVFDFVNSTPSNLLTVIRANEVAQASFAKARVAVVAVVPPIVPSVSSTPIPGSSLGDDCAGPEALDGGGQPVPHTGPRSKKSRSCLAPSRSSLRIKNLSFK